MIRFLLVALFLSSTPTFAEQHRANGLYAVFHTSAGDFTARLYEKDVPNTVQNFVGLAQGTKPSFDPKTRKMVARPLFNNITFHRVVRGEMIQSGDPTGTGRGNCGIHLEDEYLPGLKFETSGKLAMANAGQPNTGSCQWFVTVNAMPSWAGQYVVFGIIVSGQKVVEKINTMPAKGDQPVNPVTLISVTIEREGPPPEIKKPKKKS